MTFSFATGSESLRDTEILGNWLTFEPISDERFAVSGGIYSVSIGQDYPADFLLNTGSYEKDGSYLSIEKIKYIFESEDDANQFILELGIDNIVAHYENNILNPETGIYSTWHIVEIINFPHLEISTIPSYFQEKNGYRIEVLKEVTNSTANIIEESMDRDFIDDFHHGIISEPFLMYFDLENADGSS